MKRVLVLFIAVVLCVLVLPLVPTHGQGVAQEEVSKFRKVGNPINNEYIVVLNDDTLVSPVASVAQGFAKSYGG